MNIKETLRTGVRTLLKYTLNPLTRKLARTTFGPFAIIQHVGRRSGKAYETPIIVGPINNGFVIELTYGPDVDWYKNVLAAGGCTIIWHGRDYLINRVDPLDVQTGRSAFPLPAQMILRLLRRTHFSKMTIADSGKQSG